MEKNTEILHELKAISPILAEIPRVNILSVPTGYFENLEERISIYSMLNQEENKNAFINEESGIPAGYFENLSDTILAKVKEIEEEEVKEDYPVLNFLKSINVFQVPEEYFENLSDTILSKVKEIEEKEVEDDYAVLNSLKNINVFQVHEGYFENLSAAILSNIQPKEKTKVISITTRTWWKYAAAALIAGIMLVSALYFFNIGSNNIPPYLAAIKEYQTSSQIEKGIASLKDDAIITYLEVHGNITDNDAILNNIDTVGLPTEIDYLMDDNALNNYLNKINLDNK